MGGEGDEGGGEAFLADSTAPEVWSVASSTHLSNTGNMHTD